MANMTFFGGVYAANNIIDAMYHIYNVCFSCYYGSIEAWNLVVQYAQFTNNPSFIMVNLVYNFGLMYDDLKDSLAFFTGNPVVGTTDTFGAGFDLGQIIYFLLI